MREHPLGGVRGKIERAWEHQKKLRAEIKAFEAAKPYSVSVVFDPGSRWHVARLRVAFEGYDRKRVYLPRVSSSPGPGQPGSLRWTPVSPGPPVQNTFAQARWKGSSEDLGVLWDHMVRSVTEARGTATVTAVIEEPGLRRNYYDADRRKFLEDAALYRKTVVAIELSVTSAPAVSRERRPVMTRGERLRAAARVLGGSDTLKSRIAIAIARARGPLPIDDFEPMDILFAAAASQPEMRLTTALRAEFPCVRVSVQSSSITEDDIAARTLTALGHGRRFTAWPQLVLSLSMLLAGALVVLIFAAFTGHLEGRALLFAAGTGLAFAVVTFFAEPRLLPPLEVMAAPGATPRIRTLGSFMYVTTTLALAIFGVVLALNPPASSTRSTTNGHSSTEYRSVP
jgi:hypothetical protein